MTFEYVLIGHILFFIMSIFIVYIAVKVKRLH